MWIHDNYSCLTIKTYWLTGQHSQFLQCSSIRIKISRRYFSFWKVVKLRQMLFIERQWFPIVYILFTFTSSRSSGCQIQVSMLGIFTNQLSYQRYSYLIPLRAALIQKTGNKFPSVQPPSPSFFWLSFQIYWLFATFWPYSSLDQKNQFQWYILSVSDMLENYHLGGNWSFWGMSEMAKI